MSVVVPGPAPLFPGTHPFCLKWFPIWWMGDDGAINYNGIGVPVLGFTIVGWRAWTNPNQYVESTGATPADPKLNLIPNGIYVLTWFHDKPWADHHISMDRDVFELPDGTTRTPTNANFSENAWQTLQARLMNDTWPV